ncbi:MAG: SOS response-associated peptidase [Opitutus sp.]|nr:SOS response-associated peptidase [Opitutus sp.]MCS6248739.1 SOS response-associated peptidase [Opitutus sp.]MCS6275640.1 SOS response-associated peptidase [Opitutus sp.]MCS6276446.1 SOS response-associated peptidase [Opitutus sp.]MCS6301906.1 SOS response-associated peptidase [Opitutus sp.]
MCGRYVLTQAHAKSLLAQLGVRLEAHTGRVPPPSRYNIPPGGPVLAVRARTEKSNPLGYTLARPAPEPAPEPAREIAWLHWGLLPAWAGADTRPVTNARAESLAEKPSFRRAFQSRRCIIPASGFYEWQSTGRTRRPWLFRLHNDQSFAFAGLWETYRAPDGQLVESCALITTAANTLMQPIHHRMPAMLVDAAAWSAWLDPQITSADILAPLLRPLPPDALSATAVSARVNQTRNDDPACLDPAPATATDGDSDGAFNGSARASGTTNTPAPTDAGGDLQLTLGL